MAFWSLPKNKTVTQQAPDQTTQAPIQVPVIMRMGVEFMPSSLIDAHAQATFATCIRVLSESVSKLPIHVLKIGDNGKEKYLDHHLYNLVRYNPTPWLTTRDFYNSMETCRSGSGNAFAIIDRDITGEAIGLVPLAVDPVKEITGYQIVNNELYYTNNWTDPLNASEVLHFKGTSKNGIMGMNPTEQLSENLQVGSRALTLMNTYYKKGMFTQAFLKSTVGGGNVTQMQETVERFNNDLAGSENAAGIQALPPNTEIQAFETRLQDQVVIDTLKYNESAIFKFFGVADISGESKYSNLEAAMSNFRINTLSAILVEYKEELETKLLTKDERRTGVTIEFDTSGLIATDLLSQIRAQIELWKVGAITTNQVATSQNLPTFKEGDFHMYQSSNYNPMERIDQSKTTESDE